MEVCDSVGVIKVKKKKKSCNECGAFTQHKAMKHFLGTRVSMHTNHKKKNKVSRC